MARTLAVATNRLIMPSPVKRSVRFVCRICEKPFFDGEEGAYLRHMVECSEAHAEELQQELYSVKLPGFYGRDREGYELEQWVAKHKREILEGRKKM